MTSDASIKPNEVLIDAANRLDIPGRLMQIFIDADELSGDIVGELGRQLIASEDANEQSKPDINELIQILRAIRCKLHNVIYDFETHYTMDQPNFDAVGIERLRAVAKQYTNLG